MLPSTESIFSEYENLKIEINSLHSQAKTKDILLKNYEEENSRLQEIIRDLQRSKFGKKSERWESEEQCKRSNSPSCKLVV